jgi:hypothetical protein
MPSDGPTGTGAVVTELITEDRELGQRRVQDVLAGEKKAYFAVSRTPGRVPSPPPRSGSPDSAKPTTKDACTPSSPDLVGSRC